MAVVGGTIGGLVVGAKNNARFTVLWEILFPVLQSVYTIIILEQVSPSPATRCQERGCFCKVVVEIVPGTGGLRHLPSGRYVTSPRESRRV